MNRLSFFKNTSISALSLCLFSAPTWSSEISSQVTFKPLTTLTFGSTSNATLINSSTPGTFAKVSPSLTAEFNPSDSFFATTTLSGSVKRFHDSTVGSLANETSADLKSDFTWSIGDAWEFGSNLSMSYLENHVPTVGTQSVEAQIQSYFQPDFRIYGAWLGDSWSFEIGGSGTMRNYSTPTTDLRGNLFKNNYNEFRADAKVGYRWSKDLRLSLKSTIEHRTYAERMAEFSDGLPALPGFPNPLSTMLASDNEAQLKDRLGSAQITSALSLRFEKDEIYGARDSVKTKVRERASIPVQGSLLFEPEASISRQAFSHFKADPINDPKNSDARLDWDFQLKALLTWDLSTNLKVQAQYAFNQKLSNYSIQSYTENVVETGLQMQF